MKQIYCGNCGKRLSEEDKTCPKCGSKKKQYKMEFEETITLHPQVHGKVKKKGVKKPVREFKTGDDFHKKTGRWYDRKMSIDRGKDSYEEVIIDKVTEKIIHQCKEPLSKHKEHGDAKYKKELKNDS